MTYQFSREQAINIANAVSSAPLNSEALAEALAEFAPDYEHGGMVYASLTDEDDYALEDGRRFASVRELKQAYPDWVIIVLDGSYTFAKLPGSNSDGIVQSDSMTDRPFASFGIGGMVYC